jgi:hypothetical protein
MLSPAKRGQWWTKKLSVAKRKAGGQKTPSAANGDQGVDKKRHLLQMEIRGWTKKRQLLQMGTRGWTKNAICCKGGLRGLQKLPSAAKRDQGVDKNATCCKEEGG